MKPDTVAGDDLLGLEDGAAAPRAASAPRRGPDRLGVHRPRGGRVAKLLPEASLAVYLPVLPAKRGRERRSEGGATAVTVEALGPD